MATQKGLFFYCLDNIFSSLLSSCLCMRFASLSTALFSVSVYMHVSCYSLCLPVVHLYVFICFLMYLSVDYLLPMYLSIVCVSICFPLYKTVVCLYVFAFLCSRLFLPECMYPHLCCLPVVLLCMCVPMCMPAVWLYSLCLSHSNSLPRSVCLSLSLLSSPHSLPPFTSHFLPDSY